MSEEKVIKMDCKDRCENHLCEDEYCYGVMEYEVEAKLKYCGKEFTADFHFGEGETGGMIALNEILLNNFLGEAEITVKPHMAYYSNSEPDEVPFE